MNECPYVGIKFDVMTDVIISVFAFLNVRRVFNKMSVRLCIGRSEPYLVTALYRKIRAVSSMARRASFVTSSSRHLSRHPSTACLFSNGRLPWQLSAAPRLFIYQALLTAQPTLTSSGGGMTMKLNCRTELRSYVCAGDV